MTKVGCLFLFSLCSFILTLKGQFGRFEKYHNNRYYGEIILDTIFYPDKKTIKEIGFVVMRTT